MTVQVSGPLPRALVEAVLAKPQPSSRRLRGWMRRRGLRPLVSTRALSAEDAVAARSIDTEADFVQCQHPGCCALRPLASDTDCAVCGRR
jgi:hypothetical protein